jgi:hemerythrin-like metal-binding protein
MLGIASLDEQHEALVGMLEAFQLVVTSRRPDAEVCAVISTALAAIRAHFQHEEDLMAQSGFADAEAHRFEHQRLMLAVASLTSDALEKRRAPEILAENGDLLHELFRDHIGREDRALAGHLLSLTAG